MPGERLVSVWDAGYALDDAPAGTSGMPTKVLKQITMAISNLPAVSIHFSHKYFDGNFPNPTVEFDNYKTFVHGEMLQKGVPLYELEEQIEEFCWKKLRNKYHSPKWRAQLSDRYKLWQIFNRLAMKNTYPVVMRKEQVRWLMDKFNNSLDNSKSVPEQQDVTFTQLMDILDTDTFQGLSPQDIEKCVEFNHSWLVLEICQAGWLFKRTRKQSNWTNWIQRWFVLTPGKLSYYSNQTMKDKKGDAIINSHTTVENLPDYKGFIRKLPARFGLANSPYLEVEMCAPDTYEKTLWMGALREVIEANSEGVTPVQALLKEWQRKHEQRRPSVDEIETRLTRLQTTARKVREGTCKPKPSRKKTIAPEPTNEDDDGVCQSIEEEESFDNNMYAYQTDKVKLVFSRIDKDGNGFIDEEEFSEFLDGLGVNISDAEKALIYTIIDQDENGRLCFKEFEDYFIKFILGETPASAESKLRSAFLKADRDGTGTVDFREFTEFIWEKRRSVSIGQLMECFGKMSAGGNEVSYPQFREYINSQQALLATIKEEGEGEGAIRKSSQLPDLRKKSLEDVFKNMYNMSDSEGLAEYIAERWNKFASFKRFGGSGELVMSGAHGMVADVCPGQYSLLDLACFNDLPPITPKHVAVKGFQWVSSKTPGMSGKAIFPADFDGRIPIEIATNEHLSYYTASLADGTHQVNISLMYRHGIQDFTYQNRYLDDYVKNEKALGGAGIERHEFSHLDCPLEDDAGYFILGKIEDDEIHLTGFKIPTRHTLYVPPNVIHCNDYLKGTWRTMLSDEAEIDHVQLVREISSGDQVKFSFEFY